MATAPGHRMEPSSGMGPRKTMIIMVTVVGCVAILWPKVFYPMMVGNGQNKNVIKDHRGAGCCGVVLDQETFANASINFGGQQHQPTNQQHQQDQQPNLFRKRSYVPYVEIDSIRQERPPHLRPEAMHPAMRERGRAIPQAGSIHGGERPQTPPRIVEGRPGPIPGMRPPMGAGSHQATKSANSMGFIMPLYTIGIVSFFIYTIMKLIFKKSPATPYAEVKPDPAFRNEVFTADPYIKRPDDGTTKLGQLAANGGELVVAQAAVVPQQQHAATTSVQAELTIDYEQLSKQQQQQQQQKETPPEAPEQTEPTAEPVAQAPEIAAEDSSEDQPPPAHDPTTEKVVDGIVVKKVVSLEECHSAAVPEPQPEVVPSEVTEVVKQQQVPEEVVVEEFIQQQHAPTQNAPMSRIENELLDAMVESVQEIREETSIVEEVIEKQQQQQQQAATESTPMIVEQVIEKQELAATESTPTFPEASEPVDNVVEKLPEESTIEQATEEQPAPTPSAPMYSVMDATVEEKVEEVIAEIPVETVVEEEVVTLQQQSSASMAEIVPVSDEPKVEEAIPVEAVEPAAKVEEPIVEVPLETVSQEVTQEQSQLPTPTEAVPVVPEDKADALPITETEKQTVVEEVIVEQEEPATKPAAVVSEDNVDEPIPKTEEPIVVEEVIVEQQVPATTAAFVSEDKVDGPIADAGDETIVEEIIQEAIQETEIAPVVKEVVEESVALVENVISHEPELKAETEQSSYVESVQAESQSATCLPQESASTEQSTEDQQEVQQVIETIEVGEVLEVVKEETEPSSEVSEPVQVVEQITEPKPAVPASTEEIVTKTLEVKDPSDSANAPTEVEQRQDKPTVGFEAITKENTTPEAVEEPVKEAHDPEGVTEKMKIMTVLDAGTSSVLCDVAKNIAITAERLVEEVLQQAEEFVTLEQDDCPELPKYDPATQKLVDGVVIERFDRQEVTPAEELVEVPVEPAPAVGPAGPGDDDVAELDEISEDTSLSVASVIENQQTETVPEALITTEVMTTSTSSEPVFVEEDQRPTLVEAETVVEEPEPKAAGNQFGAAVVDENTDQRTSVRIEEVHDDDHPAITDPAEGKVIEEHIVPITIEGGAQTTTTEITEVTEGESTLIESPRISKTASNLPSPLVTAVPVMGAIDEQAEDAGHEDEESQLERVSKEALVERTLSEAAAVVNEIESIVDHIITEKLIQSGAPEAAQEGATVAPPRLAASAALVVEAIESKASVLGVQGMSQGDPSSDSATHATNGLPTTTSTTTSPPSPSPFSTTNRVESMSGATNTPLPASDPLPVVASSAPVPSSSDAFPSDSIPPSPAAPASPPPHDAPLASAPNSAGSEKHTSTNLHTADPAVAVNGTSNGSSSSAPSDESEGTTVVMTTTTTTTTVTRHHHLGQVPTGGVSSTVTNPKFLTLNLANYSTSDISSGNNSKSSASSAPLANRAGSGSIGLAGIADGSGDQLMELELLRKKLDETERAMTKIIANMGSIPKGQESNVTADETSVEIKTTESAGNESAKETATNGHAIQPAPDAAAAAGSETEKRASDAESSSSSPSASAGATPEKRTKKRDTSTERGTVKVMAMEVTTQRENGKRLSRPTTPLLPMGGHPEGAASASVEEKETTRSIVLDGRLPHDSKILVADSETAVEKLEPEDSEEEDDAPVILSGKMTLSLINMDFIEKDATGTVAVGEIVTELHKPQDEVTTAPVKNGK